jgi:ADP-heptose:LPS heptosyltransferase
VLTTAALRTLRANFPKAHIGLGVAEGNVSLLPAIAGIDSVIVFGGGRGFAPWQQVLAGDWITVLDFTGTDRSALATALSRASRRVTFAWVEKSWWRSLAYNEFVDSAVREKHTAEHYLDLVRRIRPTSKMSNALPRETAVSGAGPRPLPDLKLPETIRTQVLTLLREAGVAGSFALIHPGTAREDKYWRVERWAEVIDHLQGQRGLCCVLSGGNDPYEQAHVAAIQAAAKTAPINLAGKTDVLGLAALAEQARVVVSCDTGVVHLASAFGTPQVVLYGPINPFHWRPQHQRAVVLSATQPDAPLTKFAPRMKGAPMERISTALVIRATEHILAASA